MMTRKKAHDNELTCCGQAMSCVDSRQVDCRVNEAYTAVSLLRRRRYRCGQCQARVTTFELSAAELDGLLASRRYAQRILDASATFQAETANTPCP